MGSAEAASIVARAPCRCPALRRPPPIGPPQVKLADVAAFVSKGGVSVAVIVFMALLIKCVVTGDKEAGRCLLGDCCGWHYYTADPVWDTRFFAQLGALATLSP